MRSMLTGLVVGGVVALTGLGGAAVAATSVKAPERQDVAAARPGVTALGRFDQAALNRQSAATSAAKAAVASVQSGCDGAIPKSAQNGTGTQRSVAQDLLAPPRLNRSPAGQ